jgi:hypothetical protein
MVHVEIHVVCSIYILFKVLISFIHRFVYYWKKYIFIVLHELIYVVNVLYRIFIKWLTSLETQVIMEKFRRWCEWRSHRWDSYCHYKSNWGFWYKLILLSNKRLQHSSPKSLLIVIKNSHICMFIYVGQIMILVCWGI